MKKILAVILVVMMLAAMAPFALAASVSSITVSVPEIKGLTMTLTKVQDKFSHEAFMFDPNQTPYFFYFENGGTVTFSKKVTLSFVDLKTYETSTKDFEANKAIAVDDAFTGANLYYDDATKGFVGFISLNDTVRGGGAAACTLDINTLKAGGAAAPATSTAPAASTALAASTAPASSSAPAASTAPAAGTSAATDASAAAPEASASTDTAAAPSAAAAGSDSAAAPSAAASAPAAPSASPTDEHVIKGSSPALMYILLGVIVLVVIVVIIVAVVRKSKDKQETTK
jgi:hypothetical protein